MTPAHFEDRSPRPAGWRRFFTAVLPVAAAMAIGSAATLPNIPTWYAGLAKPALTPPNGVFGPVWSILYALMAYAVWRILSLPHRHPGRLPAARFFFVQLALNALWSLVFFGLHSPRGGVVVIVLLIGALGATLAAFARLDRVAAWCLAPYLAWTAFAAYLTVAIWRLN